MVPKVNLSPEEWCLEEDPFLSPLQNGSFFRGHANFREGIGKMQ